MSLTGLLSVLDGLPAYRRIVDDLGRGGVGGTGNVTVMEAAKPFVVAALWRNADAPLLVLTPSPEDARRFHEQIMPWVRPEEAGSVYLFPEPDSLPYERLATDASTTRDRLSALAALSRQNQGGITPLEPPDISDTRTSKTYVLAGEGRRAPLIVACGHAAAQKTLAPAQFAEGTHTVRVEEWVSMDDLAARWVRLGYEAVPAIEVPGTFSRRGGLIDVFPPNAEYPARIEFFGDSVESIRLFDPGTQRSKSDVKEVAIVPAREVLLNADIEARPTLDLSMMETEAGAVMAGHLDRLEAGDWFEEAEFYSPLFQRHTLFDFLPDDAVVIVDRPARLESVVWEMEEQAKEMREAQVERGQLPGNFPAPFVPLGEFLPRVGEMKRRIVVESWGDEDDDDKPQIPFSLAPGYGGNMDMAVRGIREMLVRRQRVVIASQQARRLSELLADVGVEAPPRRDLDVLPPKRSLTIVEGTVAEGWTLGSEATLLTDAEIFGVIRRRRAPRRRSVRRDAFLAELSPGDFVVHVDHGIGKFDGVIKAPLGEAEREYLVLQFAEQDKIYVPTDQMDRVTRYVGATGSPTLTRLGTQEWNRTKSRVKDSARIFAQELVDLYAVRETEAGISFGPDTVWQQEMEGAFPFEETPDQMEAILQVKDDMEAPRPMDRLVCGDVGYGKTEVALRAAFKAVMAGMQVAVLVPTTVLAQQHFTTFTERLQPFPFRVGSLSRFLTDKNQREVVDDLRDGRVDIVVGTHRLLQKDIGFKNLGLVIIDEEQRFGVMHKEQLKSFREEVDVLTLTATPIPRTLHMALSGVRDMSTIETPPEERLPIKTYVAEFDERLLREAVLRELDRGGQVFFVHNRVRNIYHFANEIQELVPEATIGVGHGQMNPDELERVMMEFGQGRKDILVCTTIIQAGLDIPNANTLIVNDADRLGLSQLYQLRGRVGRSSLRAYCYLFYQRDKVLSETAEKRLKTILAATELGAGFRIAMKDLEIRGAGSILGTEQSGHIVSVGFELYTRILAEAVEELKARRGQKAEPNAEAELPLAYPRPTIDLPLDAYIPDYYLEDTGTRLAVYQKLTKIRAAEEIDEAWNDLRDRFGPPPDPVKDVLFAARVRVHALLAGVSSVARDGSQIAVRMNDGVQWDRERMRRLVPKAHVGNNLIRVGSVSGRRENWRGPLLEVLEALVVGQ